MAAEPLSHLSFSPRQRWIIGAHVLTSTLALAAILFSINYLSSRHFSRHDLNATARPQLSPLTIRVLDALTNDLKVVVFYDRSQPLYSTVNRLLEAYKLRSPRLQIDHVDHVRYPGRAKTIQTELKLDDQPADRVIFASQGKVRVVYARDLSDFDLSSALQGQQPRRSGFRGEQLFTSAIYSVIDPEPIVACFLQGHGTHPITEQSGDAGYSQFFRLLTENNINVRSISLTTDEVPSDCQMLIIAGPRHSLPPTEIERIERYLNQGGRLFLLFNPLGRRTGLERILESWGVSVGQNYVTDPANQKGTDQSILIIGDFGSHPITQPLIGSGLALLQPRSITERKASGQNPNAPTIVELAFTSPKGEAVILDSQRPRKDPAHSGRIPVAIAVEKGSIAGISSDRGATRIIVAGDSYFLSDGLIELEANLDFGRNAAHWLLSRELLLEGIGPHPIQEYRLSITRAEMQFLFWTLIGAAPGAVLLVGGLVWLRRRS